MEFLCFEHLDGLILALPFSNVCPYHTTTTVNGPWSRAQYQYIFFFSDWETSTNFLCRLGLLTDGDSSHTKKKSISTTTAGATHLYEHILLVWRTWTTLWDSVARHELGTDWNLHQHQLNALGNMPPFARFSLWTGQGQAASFEDNLVHILTNGLLSRRA